MKRISALLLSIVLLIGICGGALAEGGKPAAEWTVMVYLCGSDLESRAHSATLNLQMISKTVPVDDVNLVIETGGAKEWFAAEDPGIEIANDKLQHWTYGKDGFVLVDEQEEACMSHAETLSEFIRWSAENYPAKKYMLLLWDHGGGSCSGLIADENYGKIPMPVYSLERALKDGGTHFDLVLSETCLMASLEMSQALAPYADYLAASEEVMAGQGTNYTKWLQYLYDRPDCSGKQLGKQICDLSQQYYVEEGDENTIAMFTMSLIDLSCIGTVAEAYEAFMREVCRLTQDPKAFFEYAKATYYVEKYMQPDMCDMYDLTRRAEQAGIQTRVTHAVQDAIEEAVVCNIRSANHSFSHGLSVWYKLNADDKTLDHFARTCINPEQLAFFDAINLKWEAPEWVYETAKRQPELKRQDYLVQMVPMLTDDKDRAYVMFTTGERASAYASYELMYQDEESGHIYVLGECGDMSPEVDPETGEHRVYLKFDGNWPTLDGVPLCMEIADDTETYVLYNVQVGIGERAYTRNLRVIHYYQTATSGEQGEEKKEAKPDYELAGLWDGLDAHSGLPGRNISSLHQYEGKPMTLYKLEFSDELQKVSAHTKAKEITITDDLQVTKEPLPKGQYLYRFVVRDVFGNRINSGDLMPIYWDGKTYSFEAHK